MKRESTKPGLARQREDFSLEGDSQLVREREASVGWNTHLALVCRAVQNSGLDLNLSLVSEPPKMDLEVGISLDIFVLLSSVNTHKKNPSLPPPLSCSIMNLVILIGFLRLGAIRSHMLEMPELQVEGAWISLTQRQNARELLPPSQH